MISVDIDPAIDKDVETLPIVDESVQEVAMKIAAAAQSLAGQHSITGAYASSIVVQKSNRSNSGTYRVFASDPKAAWIEFGIPRHKNLAGDPAPMAGRFILRTAVSVAGYSISSK